MDGINKEEWLAEKFKERKILALEKENLLKAEERKRKERWWEQFQKQVLQTKQFNLSWQKQIQKDNDCTSAKKEEFFTWQDMAQLDAIQNIKALRITGYSLTDELHQFHTISFSRLSTLSLIANGIESLPNSIGDIKTLTDINLTKNRLQRLPDSITSLANITSLNLCCNQLSTLPNNIGKLVNLKKFWVERNCLVDLPSSFVKLHCVSTNLNTNQLTQLPAYLNELSNLISLSVNLNHLESFSNSIGTMQNLTSISACRNSLMELPDSIGELKNTLVELRLDWNQIKEFPLSFRYLTKLKVLQMQSNPMTAPPIELIYHEGITSVLSYMEKAYQNYLRNCRREIIEYLQYVFMKIADYSNKTKELDGVFNSTVIQVVRGKDLPFFGYVEEALWKIIIPKYLELRYMGKKKSKPFKYSVHEVEDAITKFSDKYSFASVRENVFFVSCTCDEMCQNVNEDNFTCKRSGICLRKEMITQKEFEEDQANLYLAQKVKKLVDKVERKCIAHINSEEGAKEFEQLASKLAKAYVAQVKEAKLMQKKIEKQAAHQSKMKKKYSQKREQLIRSRAKTVMKIGKELAKIEAEMAKFEQIKKMDEEQKKKKESIEKKLMKTKSKLERPREDKSLAAIEKKIQRLDRGDGGEEDDEEADSDDSSSHSSDSESDSESSGSEYEDLLNKDMPELEPIVEYTEAATGKVKLILQFQDRKVPVEEIASMYSEHLRDTYVKERTTRVKNKIIIEFVRMQNVMKRWMGASNRVIFVAWKEYVQENVKRQKKTNLKKKRDEILAKENEKARIELGKFEALKWHKLIDPYSDREFYQHSETGETRWEPPEFWQEEVPPLPPQV